MTVQGVTLPGSPEQDSPRLEFRARWLQLLELFCVMLLALLAAAWYMWQVSLPGPIDYRPGWLMIGLYSLPTVVAVAAIVVVAARANWAVLAPDALRTGTRSVAWVHVVALDPVWYPAGRFIVARLGDGTTARLVAPRGAWWRTDRGFVADLVAARDWARRHGGLTSGEVTAKPPPYRRPAWLAVAVVVALAAWLGVHAAKVGVLTPWTPTVRTWPGCDLLAAVDLDRAWPEATGQLPPVEGAEDGTYCTSRAENPPHHAVTLFLDWCAPGDWRTSPVAQAARQFIRHDEEEPITVIGADEAYLDRSGEAKLWVRKANCTFLIEAEQDDAAGWELVDVARRIAVDVVAGIRTS